MREQAYKFLSDLAKEVRAAIAREVRRERSRCLAIVEGYATGHITLDTCQWQIRNPAIREGGA